MIKHAPFQLFVGRGVGQSSNITFYGIRKQTLAVRYPNPKATIIMNEQYNQTVEFIIQNFIFLMYLQLLLIVRFFY